MSDLQTDILADLELELSGETGYSESLLTAKVKNAIREVKLRRCYPTSYTDEQITADLDNYYSNILNLARYDYNTIGVEDLKSYSESNVSRNYVERENMFKGVLPIATIV